MRRDGFTGQRTIVIPENILREVLENPLNRTLYITDIGYYPLASEHYRSRPDGCQQHILIYCVGGRGWISVDNKKVRVSSNQYFMIPRGKAHAYGSAEKDPWSIYWIHFSGTHAAYFSDTIGVARTITPAKISRMEDRIQLFNEMIVNLEMGFSPDNIIYANICLGHFLASFRYLSQFRQIRKGDESDMAEASIRFMKGSLQSRLTLEQLAENAGYSVSHYTMVFKKKTGLSPLDYLIQLKIQKASQLLDHSTLKVNEVAARLGYEDPYYFSRIFSKVMGVSPRRYRERPKG